MRSSTALKATRPSASRFWIELTSCKAQVIEISRAVIERATDLRVRYRFKTVDSIHVASAIVARADHFLTGDRDLARCTEVAVEVI